MSVNHIAGIVKKAFDFSGVLLLCCVTAGKIRHSLPHIVGNRIFPVPCQLFHQFPGLCGIAAGRKINQPLKIAGNQNIHRRRGSQDKFSLSVIDTGLEEII